MASERRSTKILWLVIVAAPIALAFETALRLLLFPPEFELVREFLNPYLTPVAWLIALIVGAAALLGLALQRRIVAKRLSSQPDATGDQRYQLAVGVFLLTSSVPQIPSILSTFSFMFGASIVPVLAGIAVCSVGVIAQAIRIPRLIGD